MSRKTLIGFAYVAVALLGVAMTMGAPGVLISSQTVQNSGVVASANLSLYTDHSCTQILNSISWGTITPGGSTARIIYVKNSGNAPLTLSMTQIDWNPANARGPVSLTWDRENSEIGTNQVISAVLTLSVSPSADGITTFSFGIVISGVG